MKITTDMTPLGTKVYGDDGEQMHGVVAVQRRGRKTYVTLAVKDVEVEGVDGDFHLGVTSQYQPVRP
jgi:hypothetical protein